jgi:hypothetical protein
MKDNQTNGQKFCFSYIRYSSKNQEGNTSIDRQMEVAPRVAAKMGWTLRTDLAVLQKATSAYKGLNVPMIKKIIEDVENRTIPQGTAMIIEKFSRAFRQKLEDKSQDRKRHDVRSYPRTASRYCLGVIVQR